MTSIRNENEQGNREAPTYKRFCASVESLLGATAKDKNYNTTGLDGQNHLYTFVQQITGDDAHGIGEIIYKAVRYMAKRNPEDLLKIAAWAFLVWKHHDSSTSR